MSAPYINPPATSKDLPFYSPSTATENLQTANPTEHHSFISGNLQRAQHPDLPLFPDTPPGNDPMQSSAMTGSGNISAKLHECPVCPYKTTNSSHLKQHFRVHSGEKPYPCPQCSMRFTQKSNLQRHLLVHTRNKTHSCDFCSFTSFNRVDFALHMRSEHINK